MANFLQLTPENISQARNMSWGQAISQDFNPRNPNYRGFSTAYQGADKTGLGKYVTGGLKSLAGMFEPGSNVGGATPLTRKLALTAMNYAPKALGITSKILGPASFLFDATPVNADEIDGFDMKAMMAKEALFKKKQKQANIFKQIKEKQLADEAAAKQKAAEEARRQQQLDAAKSAADRKNIQQIQKYTGRSLSDYRMSRPASERQYTGHGKSGMGRDKSELMADGGLINFYRYGGFI